MKRTIEELFEEVSSAITGKELSKIDNMDLFALDEEWKSQPRTYRYFSSKLADAKNLVNRLEEELKFQKARIDRDVRREPKRFDIEKATNEAVTNIVLLDETYRELSGMLVEAKYFSDMLFGIIIALEHRRDSLKDEVKLFLSNYYAEPEKMGGAIKTKLDKALEEKEFVEQKEHLNKNKRLIESRERKLRRS